ncbi:MAG: hypothetical protein ACKO37_10065 [Vampirovibrionales bacterium]
MMCASFPLQRAVSGVSQQVGKLKQHVQTHPRRYGLGAVVATMAGVAYEVPALVGTWASGDMRKLHPSLDSSSRDTGEVIPPTRLQQGTNTALIFNAGINTSRGSQQQLAQKFENTLQVPVYTVNAGNKEEHLDDLLKNKLDFARAVAQQLTNTADRRVVQSNVRLLNTLTKDPALKTVGLVGVSEGTQGVQHTLQQWLKDPTLSPEQKQKVQTYMVATPIEVSQQQKLKQTLQHHGMGSQYHDLTDTQNDGLAMCSANRTSEVKIDPTTKQVVHQGKSYRGFWDTALGYLVRPKQPVLSDGTPQHNGFLTCMEAYKTSRALRQVPDVHSREVLVDKVVSYLKTQLPAPQVPSVKPKPSNEAQSLSQ